MSTTEPCECIKGTIHSGQPTGTYSTLHGLTTYTAGDPSTARAVIILYTDVFGHALPNNLLLADALARRGRFLVHVPDFFEGDPVTLRLADVLIPVDEKKQSTLAKYTGLLASAPAFLAWSLRHGAKRTDDLCMRFLGDVRREMARDGKGSKVGIVGYCWGGRYAIRAARRENMVEVKGGGGAAEKKMVSLVDAAVALHPSNLVLPEDADGIVVPVSVGWGEHDSMVSLKVKDSFEAATKRDAKDGGADAEIENVVWSPGRHGFAVRGNPDDAEERKILEGTESQMVKWFEKHLA